MTETFLASPARRRKTPLLESIWLFLLTFYKESGSEKISIAMKILMGDYKTSRKTRKNGFPVTKNCYYLGVYYPMLRLSIVQKRFQKLLQNSGGAIAPASPMAARCLETITNRPSRRDYCKETITKRLSQRDYHSNAEKYSAICVLHNVNTMYLSNFQKRRRA